MVISVWSYSSEKVFGGFWHIGGQVTINPQAALNAELDSLGYTGFTGTGYGMTVGGGGLINNLYLGGWGSFDYNNEVAVNNTTQRTLSGATGGRGGFEIGYAVINTPVLHLIPSLSLVWGGYSYNFTTNMSFTDYVNNPVDWSPGFGLSEFSLGFSVALLAGGKHSGFLVKAMYLYDLGQEMGPVTFTSGPAMSPHSVMITCEMYMGGIVNKKEFEMSEHSSEKMKPGPQSSEKPEIQ